MGNIVTAKVSVVGTRPLLWHRFGPDAIPLEKQERTGVAGNDPEEWKRTVLMTRDRQLYLEPTYVFGTIKNGSFHVKSGKSSIKPKVIATLQVLDDRVLIDRFVPEEPIPEDSEQPVYMDIRSVVNPSTKGRNVRYRIAAAPGWHAEFNLLWDKTLVSRGEMESSIKNAGTFSGFGSGLKIGFGRFHVLSYEVKES